MSEKLKLAEKTALDIDRLRDGYRPAARRGAILFFVLSEMALVNAMYQYSLSAFLEVFGLSLKKSLPDSILMKRLRNIMDTLTFNIYNYGCTGQASTLIRTARSVRVPPGSWSKLEVGSGLASWPCFNSTPSPEAQSPIQPHSEVLGSGLPHPVLRGAEFSPFQLGRGMIEDCCP